MTVQTIVAVYDTPAHAELAVQDLLQANIPQSAIHRHASEGSYAGSSTMPAARTTEGGGFWATLFGGEPEHDTSVYDRSVSSGSTAVTVKVAEEHVAHVTDILERHNPIDLDERAGSYGLSQTTTTRTPLAGAAPIGGASSADGGAIQLSEETLAVGKRVLNRGTTRIHRFVVETPVEEEIRLRDEKVTIDRRPVTDGRTVSDADWSDKTIEMTETAEEAVVSKTARVTEEISLRKEAAERTETIRDTVRKEDVEITKEPGELGGSTFDTTTRKTGI